MNHLIDYLLNGKSKAALVCISLLLALYFLSMASVLGLIIGFGFFLFFLAKETGLIFFGDKDLGNGL